MTGRDEQRAAAQHRPGRPGETFASNDIRLSPREWLVAGLIVAAVLLGLPAAWSAVQPLPDEPDWRLPYELGGDYWLFERWCERATSQDRTLVIGDSVVWGHYVSSAETLPAHLNRLAGRLRFANLGIDGIHPAALAGLLDHYADAVRDANVVLHANLLWLSSKRHDLQVRKEFSLNHPALVPQFHPAIPCYKATVSERLTVAIRRELPHWSWSEHLRLTCFGGSDVPRWTVEHPGRCPLRAVSLALPEAHSAPVSDDMVAAWTKKGIRPFAPEWVGLDASLQWRFLRQAVEILAERGNRLFVVLGPFNEHMLAGASRPRYVRLRRGAQAWLAERGVAHFPAAALPSEHYADASHPLGAGYALLARRLFDDPAFARFDGRGGTKAPTGGSE